MRCRAKSDVALEKKVESASIGINTMLYGGCNASRGNMDMQDVDVQCYSGRKYGERPVSFTMNDVTYRVESIEREWLEPGVRHFRVRTKDNKFFELCYDQQNDRWSIC